MILLSWWGFDYTLKYMQCEHSIWVYQMLRLRRFYSDNTFILNSSLLAVELGFWLYLSTGWTAVSHSRFKVQVSSLQYLWSSMHDSLHSAEARVANLHHFNYPDTLPSARPDADIAHGATCPLYSPSHLNSLIATLFIFANSWTMVLQILSFVNRKSCWVMDHLKFSEEKKPNKLLLPSVKGLWVQGAVCNTIEWNC